MATPGCYTGSLLPLLLLLLPGALSATADSPSNPATQSQKTIAIDPIEDQRDVEFWEKLRQKEDSVPLDYIKEILKSSSAVSSTDHSVSSLDDQQQLPGYSLPLNSSTGDAQADKKILDVKNQSEPAADSVVDQAQPPKQQQGEDGRPTPLPPPTNSSLRSNISASDVSDILRNLTASPDGRQIKSGGSALTAALMIGGPMLAGAIYAGANAPSEFGEGQALASANRRQDGGQDGVDQEEDFNWQTLLQRTVGNIRNTASNVQDSVIGFFSPSDDRSTRPSAPKTSLEGSLPPAHPSAAGGGRPKRRRKRPNAQAVDDEIRIQVPYVGGIPLFPQLGGEGQQVNPEALLYLQQQQQLQQQQRLQQLQLQEQYSFMGQQPQVLAGPPIPHDYPIDPGSGIHRQQAQGQPGIVGGHGLASGLHPYNQHGVSGGYPIQSHDEDPNHHLVASSGKPSIYSPAQGASSLYHTYDGQQYHLQSPAQQYVRDPSTGQIIDINSLAPRDTLDGVRRFDGRKREGVSGNLDGGLRRFDERQVKNAPASSGARTLSSGDGSSSSTFGPLKRSDALEYEPPNRERGQIREQKELVIEGLESIPTVHVMKNREASAPQTLGRKIESGFDINNNPSQLLHRSESSRLGSRTTVPYVNKDGTIHFLEVPERYGEMRRLRRPTKGKQRRRNGGPGGSRVRNMKLKNKLENSEKLEQVVQPSIANSAGFTLSDINVLDGPLKFRAFNHKYSSSSEERRIVQEYINPTDFKGISGGHGNTQHQFLRGPFLGKPHSSSPFLGAGTVEEQKVPEVPEKITNFTTSFRVFDLENANDMRKIQEPLGRITYTQIYGEVKPESVLSNTDLNILKTSRPGHYFRDHKQGLYQRPDLFGYGRGQQNNDDPHQSKDFQISEMNKDVFVIEGNLHRKITVPQTLPPSMLGNEIEERSDTAIEEDTLFRDDIAASHDSVSAPGILSHSRDKGSREFQMNENDNFSNNKQFRLESSREEIRRLDEYHYSEENGVGVTLGGSEYNNRKRNDVNHMGENKQQFSSTDSKTSNNQLHRHIQPEYGGVSNEPRRAHVSSTRYAHDPSSEMNLGDREYKTENRYDEARDSFSEKLLSVNLGELSPRSPLKIQPASFEVYKISPDADRPKEKQYSHENKYHPLASTNQHAVNPFNRSKPQNIILERKSPPPLPRPIVGFNNLNRRNTPAPAGRTTAEYRESEELGYKEPTRERGTKLRTETKESGRVPTKSEQEENPSQPTEPDSDDRTENYEREKLDRRRRPSTRESLRLQENEGRRTLSAELDTYIRSKTRLPVRQRPEEDKNVEEYSGTEPPSNKFRRERLDDRPNVNRPASTSTRRKPADLLQRTRPADLPRREDSDSPLGFEKNDKTYDGEDSPSYSDKTEDDDRDEQKYRRRKPGLKRRKRIRQPQGDEMTDVARVAEKRIRANQMKIAEKIDEEQANYQDVLRFGANFDPFESVQDDTKEVIERSSSENKRGGGPNPISGYSTITKNLRRLKKPSPADPYTTTADKEPASDLSQEEFGKRQRRLPARRSSPTNFRESGQYNKPYPHYPPGEEDMSNSPSSIQKRYSDYTPADRFRSVDLVAPATLDKPSLDRFNSEHAFLASDETGFSERLGHGDNLSRKQYDTTVEFLKDKRDRIGHPSLFSPEQKPEIKPIPVSSFTSQDASVLPARFRDPGLRVSIRDKIDRQEEPNIITIGDIRNGVTGFSNQQSIEELNTRTASLSSQKEVSGFMKRVQDDITAKNDPIISNLKAIFMESAPESPKRIKSAFWQMGDSPPNAPVIGSFVDPSGRTNNPVRSFNLPKSNPFPEIFGNKFGSIENLERHHLTPQDLYEKDRKNFASVVLSSELTYGVDHSRASSRVGSNVASNIVTGRISHDSRPRIPYSSERWSNRPSIHSGDEPQYESLQNLLPQKLVAERPDDDNTVIRKNSEQFTGRLISFETSKEPSLHKEELEANTETETLPKSNENFTATEGKTVTGLVGHNPGHIVIATKGNEGENTDSHKANSKTSLMAGQSKMFELSHDFALVHSTEDFRPPPRSVLRVKKIRKISRRSSGEALSSIAHPAKQSLLSLFPFAISEPTSKTILIEKNPPVANTEETTIYPESSVQPHDADSTTELTEENTTKPTENLLNHSKDEKPINKNMAELTSENSSSEQRAAEPPATEFNDTKPNKDLSITIKSDDIAEN